LFFGPSDSNLRASRIISHLTDATIVTFRDLFWG